MATQRYTVTPHPIETPLTWVKSGEIAIPEIQRPFVWEATKVRNLLDSLYRGYPVGYLMHLDDIEDTTAPKAEEYLSKIRAIRRCALPVIQMTAQLEEFQKKLWLKKKFVVETRYCLTLDRVPETLYPEICTTDAQWQEWDELVALSELQPKRTPEFLRANAYLAIATSSAGETKETTVDLVETFNWLLGLEVKHIDTAKGFLTVSGEKRAGGRCLILRRTLSADTKADNEALERFLTKLDVNPADTEFDFIYVNGPHTLNDPHNKVHLIEETFQRLMFDTTNFESLS